MPATESGRQTRRPTRAQRTGAGGPGSVDNPDLDVGVLGRVVVEGGDAGAVVMTVLGAGPPCTAVVGGVDGGGLLFPDEHDVAAAATATAARRHRLNAQVE